MVAIADLWDVFVFLGSSAFSNESWFTCDRLREKNLAWTDIFEEISVSRSIRKPRTRLRNIACRISCRECDVWRLQVKVSNSALVSSLMTELEPEAPATQVLSREFMYSVITSYLSKDLVSASNCCFSGSVSGQ